MLQKVFRRAKFLSEFLAGIFRIFWNNLSYISLVGAGIFVQTAVEVVSLECVCLGGKNCGRDQTWWPHGSSRNHKKRHGPTSVPECQNFRKGGGNGRQGGGLEWAGWFGVGVNGWACVVMCVGRGGELGWRVGLWAGRGSGTRKTPPHPKKKHLSPVWRAGPLQRWTWSQKEPKKAKLEPNRSQIWSQPEKKPRKNHVSSTASWGPTCLAQKEFLGGFVGFFWGGGKLAVSTVLIPARAVAHRMSILAVMPASCIEPLESPPSQSGTWSSWSDNTVKQPGNLKDSCGPDC